MEIKFYDDPVRYHREYYLKRRQEYLDYLGGGPCASCGSPDDLEFDHIDPAQKSFNIRVTSAMTNEVKAELDKCQLLCNACHREKSAAHTREVLLASGFTHGTQYAWMKRKCRCEVCTAAKDAYNQERRQKRIDAGGGGARLPYGRPSTHGEKLHYTRGCRCAECRAANAAAERERNARAKANSEPG